MSRYRSVIGIYCGAVGGVFFLVSMSLAMRVGMSVVGAISVMLVCMIT